MTRRTFTSSGTKRCHRRPQALNEVDTRAIPEDPLRLREIGPGVPDVACPGRQVPPLDLLSEDLADRVGDPVQARRGACGHVEDLPVRTLRAACEDRRVDDVPDVGEVARLLAVA